MPRNRLTRLLSAIWRALDGMRKVLHLLVLLVFFLALLAVFAPKPPLVPRSAALVLAPVGAIVEQLDGDAASRAWQELTGTRVSQTLAKDLIDAIDAASGDDRIKALVLQLNSMGGAGLATLHELGAAIDSFKSSGKPVIAIGDAYSQAQYYLAAHANEIYLHPQGFVFLQGFGSFRAYYKQAIDKLYVDWNVFKVGEFKSFVEPYTRDDMSPEARENAAQWLGGLWAQYQDDVGAARGLSPGALERYTERLPELLSETDGDLAELAVEANLVDELRSRDEMVEYLKGITGEDSDDHGFLGVHHADYVRAVRLGEPDPSGARVGIVVASGEILPGNQPPGIVGGESTAALLRRARYDDDIKAVVLRVDSPGGSAFASEIIGAEVQALRTQGKPVVVSMGSVAASGGYWISMDANEIWAHPSTITGSIGIGAYFPTFQRSLDKLGVHVDGVGTTPWAGDFRPDRELSDAARAILQLSIENGYQRFISKVANAREMSVDRVDEVARGRVWLGGEAQQLGLVDHLGNLDEAVISAGALAGLLPGYDIEYLERQPSIREALVMEFAGAFTRALGAARGAVAAPVSPLIDAARRLGDDIERLARWNDPRGMYYHCLCDPR